MPGPGSARSAPARALSSVRAAISWAAGKVAGGLTLVPSFLSGLLWLISQSFLDLAKQGYGGNSAAYSCIRVLCESVAEPPLLAYTQTPAGEPDQPLPYDHPLMQLIRRPNELMTEFQMWELVTLHQSIGGHSHWWKERDNSGRILALWPLRPDRVGPIYSDSLAPGEHVLSGWSYHVPGTTHYVPLRRKDVLTYHLPDPSGESGGIVEGLGSLAVLAAEVGADNEATRFVGSMLANYGAPGVVLTTKTPLRSEEDAKLIKAAFVREFGGQRRGLPAVVDSETVITPFGFSLQQLEFPHIRKVAESRIAAAIGVPAVLAQLQVGLENGQAYAALAQMREYFTETTLASHWRRNEDQYTADVASEYGTGLICRYDLTKVKALAEQQRNVASKVERAMEMGACTIDEYRAAVLNYEPLPGGQGKIRIVPRGGTEIDEHGNIAGPAPRPTVDTIASAAAAASAAPARTSKNGAHSTQKQEVPA